VPATRPSRLRCRRHARRDRRAVRTRTGNSRCGRAAAAAGESLRPLPDKCTVSRHRAALPAALRDLIRPIAARVFAPHAHTALPAGFHGRTRLHRGRDADDAADTRWSCGAAVRDAHNALDIDMYCASRRSSIQAPDVGGFERVYEINRTFATRLSTQHNPSSPCSSSIGPTPIIWSHDLIERLLHGLATGCCRRKLTTRARLRSGQALHADQHRSGIARAQSGAERAGCAMCRTAFGL